VSAADLKLVSVVAPVSPPIILKVNGSDFRHLGLVKADFIKSMLFAFAITMLSYSSSVMVLLKHPPEPEKYLITCCCSGVLFFNAFCSAARLDAASKA